MASVDICSECKKTGLGMLVTLVLPTPKGCGPTLPGWVKATQMTSVSLSDYQYSLRTLRAGYLYVFFSKNSRGSNRWQVWDVSADGQTFPMPTTQWIVPIADTTCKRSGHSAARLHHIVIEDPHLCGTAWIAFSQHLWSEDTLKRYAGEATLRGQRMMAFEPATLIATDTAAAPGFVPASPSVLASVCDYADGFDKARLPYSDKQGQRLNVSVSDKGEHNPEGLRQQSTRYPWAEDRKCTADKACENLRSRSRKLDGSPHPGIVVALPDPLGSAMELSGYCNDTVGRVAQYGEERALQISAYNTINGLENALADHAAQVARNTSEVGMFQWSDKATQTRMANVRKQYPNDAARIAREQDLCARWERDAQQGIPSHIANQRQFYLSQSQAVWQAEQAEVDSQAAKYTTPTKSTGTSVVAQREARSQQWEKDAKAKSHNEWVEKYYPRIDPKAMDNFKKLWDAFNTAANDLAGTRALQLVKWLESNAFVALLEDFHPANIEDGIAFENIIGELATGLDSHDHGRAKIDAWVAEMKASPGNLVWRVLALNQQADFAKLEAALKDAAEHQAKRTEAQALTIEGTLAKTAKAVADTYKKAVGVYNANARAASEKGSKAFGIKLDSVNTRNCDKVATVFGDRVFRRFRVNGLGDFVSEKVIQHMFSIRAFVDPRDSANLITQQVQADKVVRTQTLQSLHASRTFMGFTRVESAQTQQLKEAWRQFKNKPDDGPNAIRDARLAAVVLLIEGVNFQKLLAECRNKNDAKSWWSLAASSITISSALADIGSVPAKALLGSEGWSYQRFKFWGGMLSVAATGISVGIDFAEAKKASGKNQDNLRKFYVAKFVLGGANLALTSATTFTYAAPLIKQLTGRAAAGATAVAIGENAARIIATRILFMSAGAWITVGTFAIQCFIWKFSDDALQEWCSLSAFGRNRTATDAFKDASLQDNKLKASLMDVGVTA